MVDVTLSIVATNERDVLRDCLLSIREWMLSGTSYEVYVVDNNSSDGTSEMLAKEFPKVKVLHNNVKQSFCENHNMVIEKSTAKYVFIMNSDVFITKGHVEQLMQTLESNPSAGIVMGKLISGTREKNDNIIDSTGHIIFRDRRTIDRGQGEEDRGQYNGYGEIFSASGAAMLCRREMLEDIKLFGEYFDTDFYAYKEELDVCWRARLKGWRIFYDPKAVAFHLRGWGLGTSRSKLPRPVRRHSYKNRYLLLIKNEQAANFLADLPRILLHEIKAFIFVVFREPHLFIAWYDIIRLLPSALSKRREIMRNAKVTAADIRAWFR
jgi:GT2 family glycosyltransferase